MSKADKFLATGIGMIYSGACFVGAAVYLWLKGEKV